MVRKNDFLVNKLLVIEQLSANYLHRSNNLQQLL